MKQLMLGYIPKEWKEDDNENRPGWISTGSDDGTVSSFIEYENIYDDDDLPEEIRIDPEGGDIRFALSDENFKKNIQKNFRRIFL